MAYPSVLMSRQHKFVRRRTGTNMSVASATAIDMGTATNGPGAGGFDLTLSNCQVGDTVLNTLHFAINNGAVEVRWDVATIVGGTLTNYISGGGTTMADNGAWYASSSSGYLQIAGTYPYVLQAADITTDGKVTFRPYYKGGDATSRSIYSSSTTAGFLFMVANIGPQDAT